MKKILFLLLGLAVAGTAAAGVNASRIQTNVKKVATTTQARYVDGKVVSKPAPKFAPTRDEIPAGYARVTLTAGDVWGDGSGYQMLFDADATAYGTVIPETGALTTSGDAPAATYAEFEYKIPENADGAMSTANIVINNSITLDIPAGTYDWVITNPTPDDRIWIASENGNVPGRYDDFQFAEGVTYVFEVSLGGQNDQVMLTVQEPGSMLTVPENLAVVPGATTAAVSWLDNDDSKWNLRYRPFVDTSNSPINITLPADTYEAELDGIAVLDADGDGDSWGLYYTDDAQTDLCLSSASYGSSGAMTPDNWLIMPLTKLQGIIRFDVWNHSASYPEMLQVMIGMEDAIDGNTVYTDQFTTIKDFTISGTTEAHETVTLDLTEYNGQNGYVVFRHTGTTDMWRLYLDNIFIGDPNAEVILPAEWIYVNDLTETAYTIDGLTPETQYEVQVQAVGSVMNSEWTEILSFFTTADVPAGLRGDVDNSQSVNIADVTALIDGLLSGNWDGANYDNADCNLDGGVNIADVTALIDYLLSGVWSE